MRAKGVVNNYGWVVEIGGGQQNILENLDGPTQIVKVYNGGSKNLSVGSEHVLCIRGGL